MVDVDPSVWAPRRDSSRDRLAVRRTPLRPVVPLQRIQRPRGNAYLRPVLAAVDVASAAAGWTATISLSRTSDGIGARVALIPCLTLLTVAAFAAHHLYRARVCALRARELAGLARGTSIVGLVAVAFSPSLGHAVPLGAATTGAIIVFSASATLRSLYLSWLRTRRASGRYVRPIVLVGTNDEASHLAELVADHPEHGFRICGVVGDASEWQRPEPVLGPQCELISILDQTQATGALITTSAVPSTEVNDMVRSLHRAEKHVQVSNPMNRIGHRRQRPAPIAHEPVMYLEPLRMGRWQHAVKRCLDVVVATTALVFAAPVLAVAAAAIKLEDGGPVSYRQTRIGLHGDPFPLLKLRTMIPDASSHLPLVQELNERRGPLFKVQRDPRVTRVGELLRALSIDELPQLFNVLSGKMSLVGPRPALPEEVAQFDEELLARLDVLPGVTGLWQVEGRDNPSFAVYRRLDLFYVENQSLALDVSILFATAKVVSGRGIRVLRRRSRRETSGIRAESPSPVNTPARIG